MPQAPGPCSSEQPGVLTQGQASPLQAEPRLPLLEGPACVPGMPHGAAGGGPDWDRGLALPRTPLPLSLSYYICTKGT